MGEYNESDHLSEILKAASDSTRRSLLTALVQEGPTRVTDLADRYDMSLNAISKHIKVLEKAGLVTRKTVGRVHLIEAKLEHVRLVEAWFQKLRSIWEIRLDHLSAVLEKGTKEMSEISLTMNKTVPAPPEKVFNAWLDPEMLVKFMVPMEGAYVSGAEVDAKEGGKFSFIFMDGEEKLPHHGEYKEISPHSKLVFSWNSPFSVDDSMVHLTFTPNGDDATDVELYHEKFATESSRDSHKNGWTSILDTLARSI